MRKEAVFILFLIFFLKSNAQDLVPINDPANPESSFDLEQLIEEVLVSGGCSGVSNFSSQSGGTPTDLANKSYGYFNNGTAVGFPFEKGIVITTGKASEGGNTYVPNPPAPNVFPDNNIGIAGDADIENILNIDNTNDATFVKFNFVPATDTINFRFIMASEEYDGITECTFTDGFAFLLREVGTANYTNIAVLPNGTPVSVKTINEAPGCTANANFFAGYEIRDTNYGGRTVVLNATSPVISGRTYEIKLVIADQGDANKDSAIFLEGGSFDLGGDLGEDITIANGTAVCEGESITLNTQAATATHKWYLDGVEIPGAGDGETLTINQPGTYSVDVTFTAACIVNDSILVEFRPQEDASFTVMPTCDGATMEVTGNTGGVFSFNPVPGDGAIIDPVSGTVTNGTVGTTYTVEYKTSGECSNTKSNSVTVSSSGNATFTTTATCDGGTATITGDTGGVFTFDPVPTDGAVIDAVTGTVTMGISGITYTIKYSTPGACGTSTTQDLTVLNSGNATFTTMATCDGGTATITGDAGGVFTFDPVPTDGAVIDAVTGTVTMGVSGTIYTIKYSTSGACGTSTTQDLTVLNSGNATFTAMATCDGGTATITGDAGGVFIFDPVPTDGAVIDTVTGTVTMGVSGTTYTIRYTVSGDCGTSTTQDLTVLNSGSATFEVTPRCDGGFATITGAQGGVFTFDPVPTDGAVIDAATGTITNGVSGATYTIRYTTSGACGATTTQDITLLSGDSSFTLTPTCDGAIATITGVLGGVFVFFDPQPTDGATINSLTGEVTGAVFGTTYVVEYSTGAACEPMTIRSFTPLESLDPSFTTTPTCDGGTITITGDTGGVFTFNPAPTDGAVIDAVTGTITNGTSGETYTIEYTTSGACIKSSMETVTVYLVPVLVTPQPLVSCDEETTDDLATFDLESKNEEISDANPDYRITYHETITDANLGVNSLVSPYLSVSKTVYARAENISDECFATTALDLEVAPSPTVTNATYALCDDNIEFDGNPNNDIVAFNLESQNATVLNGQDPTTNTVSYYASQADAEAAINALTSPYDNITNPQTIVVRVDNNDSDCFALGELILEVNPIPSFDLQNSYTFCIDADGSEVTPPPVIDTELNNADYSFEWYLNGVLIGGAVNSSYVPTQTGTYNVIVTNVLTGCRTNINDPNTITTVNESVRPFLTANQVSLAFVERNTILATATNAAPLSNGNAVYEFSLDGGPWVSNTPNDGTYTFENVAAGMHTIEARDINGCGVASVTLTVLDYPLYFTPNGDGFHDLWNVVGIANQPEAQIYIFDRYGKLLKQMSPSSSGWDGTFNNQLMPSDDYWFMLNYNEPNTNKRSEFKAHFTLKR